MKLRTLGFFLVLLAAVGAAPLWASGDELEIQPRFHVWGAEADLAWHPLQLLWDRQTSFLLGAGAVYKTWYYFHSPSDEKQLTTASVSDAANKALSVMWYTGFSQGLVGREAKLLEGREWDSHDFLEAFVYYRGHYYDYLTKGTYLSSSSINDRDSYAANAFMGGLSLNRMSKADLHELKSGFLLEGAYELAPNALQTVNVDYSRLTFNLKGFFPLYDMAPQQRLNVLSVLGGVNMVYDHLSGSNIPAIARQQIGGRVTDGMGGWGSGIGGAVRGIEDGRYDGKDKFVTNVEVRVNLPGFEVPNFVGMPLVGQSVYIVPGIVGFYDYGQWNEVAGSTQGSVTSTGLGFFLHARNYGTVAIYLEDWLTGGTPYEGSTPVLALSLGMQF